MKIARTELKMNGKKKIKAILHNFSLLKHILSGFEINDLQAVSGTQKVLKNRGQIEPRSWVPRSWFLVSRSWVRDSARS